MEPIPAGWALLEAEFEVEISMKKFVRECS